MLVIGIIILVVGSIVRGWSTLNHSRHPSERAMIFNDLSFSITVSAISITLGVVGSIFIGVGHSWWMGLVAFVAYLILSYLWWPFIVALHY